MQTWLQVLVNFKLHTYCLYASSLHIRCRLEVQFFVIDINIILNIMIISLLFTLYYYISSINDSVLEEIENKLGERMVRLLDIVKHSNGLGMGQEDQV